MARSLPTISSPSLGNLTGTGQNDARGLPIYSDTKGRLLTQSPAGGWNVGRQAPTTAPVASNPAPQAVSTPEPVVDTNQPPAKKFVGAMMDMLSQYQGGRQNQVAAGLAGNRAIANAADTATLAPVTGDMTRFSPDTQSASVGMAVAPLTVVGKNFQNALDTASAQATTIGENFNNFVGAAKTLYPFEINQPPQDIVNHYKALIESGQLDPKDLPASVADYVIQAVDPTKMQDYTASQLAKQGAKQTLAGTVPLSPSDITSLVTTAQNNALAWGLQGAEKDAYIKSAIDSARSGTGQGATGSSAGAGIGNNFWGIEANSSMINAGMGTLGTAKDGNGKNLMAFASYEDGQKAAMTNWRNSKYYKGKTVQQAINTWNGNSAYTVPLLQQLEKQGISHNMDAQSLTDDQLKTVLNGIASHEQPTQWAQQQSGQTAPQTTPVASDALNKMSTPFGNKPFTPDEKVKRATAYNIPEDQVGNNLNEFNALHPDAKIPLDPAKAQDLSNAIYLKVSAQKIKDLLAGGTDPAEAILPWSQNGQELKAAYNAILHTYGSQISTNLLRSVGTQDTIKALLPVSGYLGGNPKANVSKLDGFISRADTFIKGIDPQGIYTQDMTVAGGNQTNQTSNPKVNELRTKYNY